MTGGRLYAHSLERVMPGFAEEAPVERLVTREKISFITDDDSVTLDYHTGEAFSAEAASYTVLRGKFDQWLQERPSPRAPVHSGYSRRSAASG